MEKKTIDTLRVMLCGEIEDIAKKGTLSHETLDILKDLVETEKNLGKIEKYDMEKEEKQMGMDMGYSQRKYYIDADYQPGGNSYARGGNGGSYARGGGSYGRGMYDMNGGSYMDGNSYIYYDPRYENPMYSMARGGNYGYARTGSKEETMNELRELMNGATDEKVKAALQEAITKMSK